MHDLKLWSINRDKVCGVLKVAVGEGNLSRVKGIFKERDIEGYVEIEQLSEE